MKTSSPLSSHAGVVREKNDAPSTPTPAAKTGLWGGLLAGIAASACCAGPLVLLSLGLGGSWLSTFSKLEPLRPLFILLALAFLGIAYRRLYILPRRCQEGAVCATDDGLRGQRRLFWWVTVAVVAVISFPWWGVWLLDS